MFNIFTNLILVGCSNDFGLNNTPVDPVVKDLAEDAPAEATNECECPDNSAELTTLQEELASLRDRVGTLESAPALEPDPDPEVLSSAMVVTEYEVMCTAGRESDGTIILQDPLITSMPNGETLQVGCRLAMIDPSDRPFIINVGTLQDYALDEEASPYHAWEPGPRFAPFHFDALDVGMGTLIMSDGAVISQAIVSYALPWPYSADTEEFLDLPVRVVIIDDKPALRPEAW